jgi:cell division transport system ATP-binding protein
VFQDHKLLYDRNCYHNVALPLAINGITGADAGKRIRAALDKVGLLNKEKAMPITLSGGEQQRLEIARAVVSRPSILIADEPTGNLDKNYADDILALFSSFQQVGVTVIIATHDAFGTENQQNKVLHLDHGRLVNLQATA